MILYNITVNIDHDIHQEWLFWMKDVHIPDVLSTGLFIENKIAKIHAEEDGGLSYSIQYLLKSWPTIIELASVYKRLREFERQLKTKTDTATESE